MIKLEHISKTFGDTGDGVHAVKDVSLEIGDGEIFGIIGFSGAGKSTLVRCINLLERPTSGSITVNGQKLTWMEKQADRGAYGLMMPVTFMRGLMAEKRRTLRPYAHEGEKYEQIGLKISAELCLPHFRVKARMIQLGHLHAKGALNYVNRRRIQPYSFEDESLCEEEYLPEAQRIPYAPGRAGFQTA